MKGRVRLQNPIWGIVDLVDMDTPESSMTIVQFLRTIVYAQTHVPTTIEYFGELKFGTT